jgi:hypothetical protein
MVAITVLCTRIRYTRIFLHLVNNDLAGGIEEDGTIVCSLLPQNGGSRSFYARY